MTAGKKRRAAAHGEGSPGRAEPARAPSARGKDALSLEERVEEIHRRVVERGSAELAGLLDLLGSRRRVMWMNFLAGMSRGVGFFLGVSLLGGVLLGLLAISFDKLTATLGFKDLTLKQTVRMAYMKFQEIQDDLEDVKAELAAARRDAEAEPAATEATGAEPVPDPER